MVAKEEEEEPMPKSITVRLPDALHELLRKSAFKERKSQNAIVVAALEAMLYEQPIAKE